MEEDEVLDDDEDLALVDEDDWDTDDEGWLFEDDDEEDEPLEEDDGAELRLLARRPSCFVGVLCSSTSEGGSTAFVCTTTIEPICWLGLRSELPSMLCLRLCGG